MKHKTYWKWKSSNSRYWKPPFNSVPVLIKTFSHESWCFPKHSMYFLSCSLQHCLCILWPFQIKGRVNGRSPGTHYRWLCPPVTKPGVSWASVPAILTRHLWQLGRVWRQEIDMVLRCHGLPHDVSLRISERKAPPRQCFPICLWPNSRLTNAINNNKHLPT